MSYLRQPRQQKPAKFVSATHKLKPPHVEMAKHPERYPSTGSNKKLFFPLRKDNLTVPQMTLREIAWTILDWQTVYDALEMADRWNTICKEQKLTPIEKDYIWDLIPRLRDEELRVQMFYAA
jgi:hypothetical protein